MSEDANADKTEVEDDSKKNKRGKASKKGSMKGSKKESAKEEPVKKGSKKGSKKPSQKAEPSEKEEAKPAPKKRGRAAKTDESTDKTEGKQEKKSKTAVKKGSAKKEEPGRKSTREKKVVAQFVPEYKEKEERTIVIPEGPGESLGDIDNVTRALDALKAVDPLLKKIHSILYGHLGVKATVKKNVRQFKGIPKAEADEWNTKTRAKLEKLEATKDLKPMCRVFDLEVSGTREEAIDRILEFLRSPKASGGEYKGGPRSGKRKKSTKKQSSKKGKEKKEKSSRPPSGFLLFSTTNRPTIKAKDPELSFGDLGRKLGKLWGKLSDSEKATWTEKARKQAGEKSKDAKPAKKKSKTNKKESSSESESSESEADEGLGANLEAKISEIVKAGDLAQLSVKKIKVQLASEFGEALVSEKGDQIKKFVNKCVQNAQ